MFLAVFLLSKNFVATLAEMFVFAQDDHKRDFQTKKTQAGRKSGKMAQVFVAGKKLCFETIFSDALASKSVRVSFFQEALIQAREWQPPSVNVLLCTVRCQRGVLHSFALDDPNKFPWAIRHFVS